MSAVNRGKVAAFSNAYAALLALALAVVIAVAVYAAITCYTQYGTFFKVVSP